MEIKERDENQKIRTHLFCPRAAVRFDGATLLARFAVNDEDSSHLCRYFEACHPLCGATLFAPLASDEDDLPMPLRRLRGK